MEISTTSEWKEGHSEEGVSSAESLTALACSCLLSLVISRGDTGKLLAAAAAMLMSPGALSSQHIKVIDIINDQLFRSKWMLL